MAILGELVVCMFVYCWGMPRGAVAYESAVVYMYIRSGSNEHLPNMSQHSLQEILQNDEVRK